MSYLRYIPGVDKTLDCQECGEVLRVLTNAEAQKVSYNPYDYVFYCHSCQRQLQERIDRGEML